MAKVGLLLTVLLGAVWVACAEDNSVLVLTDDTIDSAIKQNEIIMIKFYAPWCGHCKRMAPDYEKAAEMLKEKGSKAVIAKLDATVERKAASDWNIRGYPTVLTFKNGQMIEKYAGPRTAKDIANYVLEKADEKKLADL